MAIDRFHLDRLTADISAGSAVTTFVNTLTDMWSWARSRTCARCAKTPKMEKDGDETFEQSWQISERRLDAEMNPCLHTLCRQNLRRVSRASFGKMVATFCLEMGRQLLVCGENTGEITIQFCFIRMDSFTTFT